MAQKRQKHAAGMMRVTGGKQADAIFAARRKHRMRQRNLTMVEHDDRDILKWHERSLLLLNGQ